MRTILRLSMVGRVVSAGMSDQALKLVMVAVVVIISLATGRPALMAMRSGRALPELGFGEAFAAGIFLGAGLIHMLGDSQSAFDTAHVDYPFAMVICGSVMLLLLWIEHLANRGMESSSGNSKLLPLTAVAMLSIHSLLMGAAFGVSSSVALTVVIFIAVLAHKGSASFALGLELGRSEFSKRSAWRLFLVFVLMFPLGALVGQVLSTASDAHPLVEASISAAAAGTFLFFGTLHGLASSPMINRCCNQREFIGAVGGFALMAVVAIWT